jgi:GntR family transcriptional regulator
MDWNRFLKDNRTPLYQQIQTFILQAIRAQELLPDDQVPSAGVLSKKWGISRMTVIQAFQELQRRGFLYTVAGKGTFISPPRKMIKPLEKLYGFTEECDMWKLCPTSKLINLELKPANEEISQILQIKPGTEIYIISRIRLINDKPIGVEYSHLSAERFPGLERFDWNNESLYKVLRNFYQADIDHAAHDIEAAIANEEMSRWLNVPRHFPVLVTRRYTYTSTNEIFEFVEAFYRSDRIRLRMGNLEKNPVEIKH